MTFTRRTIRDLATQREFTSEQIDRLRHLAAYGPCEAQPVDRSLAARGWIESYDGVDSVDLVANAPIAVLSMARVRG